MARLVISHNGQWYRGMVLSEPLRPTMWEVGTFPWKVVIFRTHERDVENTIDSRLFHNDERDKAAQWMRDRIDALDAAMNRRVAPFERQQTEEG